MTRDHAFNATQGEHPDAARLAYRSNPEADADTDFITAMSANLPYMAPRGLDEMAALECAEGICAEPIQSDNSDIAVSESAYFPLTAEEMAEGDLTEQRR